MFSTRVFVSPFVLLCAAVFSAGVFLPTAYGQASNPVATCIPAGAPSPGAEALASGKYDEAIHLFQGESKTEGEAGNKAHDGLVRALLASDKLKDADTEAKAWSTADASNPWARLAMAEALWREGHLIEAQASFQDISKVAGCNAQLHADFARVLDMLGLHATASRQIALAHQLDPQDPSIAGTWLRRQPRSVRLQRVEDELKSSPSLSEEARKNLEARKAALSSPPTGRGCHLVTPIANVTLPFRTIRDSPTSPMVFGLEVGINGKQRRLEFDTGASGLVLYRSAANALHLQPEVHFKSGGIGDSGDVSSFAARTETIKIGSLEFADCYVQVIDDPNQRDSEGKKIDQAADGLIGGDVFSSFLLTMDFPGQALKLDPLPPLPGATGKQEDVVLDTDDNVESTPMDRFIDPSMATWQKFYMSQHDVILPVILNGGPYKLFIVDTGAGLNLISTDAAREVGKVSSMSDVDLLGISGNVRKTYTTAPMELTFAGLKQKITGLTATDTSRFGRYDGVEISGFLGTPTLHQLTIQLDYRDNLIHLTFDPKRLRRCATNIQVDDCY